MSLFLYNVFFKELKASIAIAWVCGICLSFISKVARTQRGQFVTLE